MTKQKTEQIGMGRKVWGVPKLPSKIDAMYNNVCSGTLSCGYHDSDPIEKDQVYGKLEKLNPIYGWDSPSGSERVAQNHMHDMKARQMNEGTYNHIRKMPLWLLKLEFAVKHERDRKLRRSIDQRTDYMFSDEKKEWLD